MQSLFAVLALASAGVLASNLLQMRFHDAENDQQDMENRDWFDSEEQAPREVSPFERTLSLVVFGVLFVVFSLLFLTTTYRARQVQRENALSPIQQLEESRRHWAEHTKEPPAAIRSAEGVGAAIPAESRERLEATRSTLRLEAARRSLAELPGVKNVYIRDVGSSTVVLGVDSAQESRKMAEEMALQACWLLEEHDVTGGVVHVVDDALYRQGDWQHLAVMWCP